MSAEMNKIHFHNTAISFDCISESTKSFTDTVNLYLCCKPVGEITLSISTCRLLFYPTLDGHPIVKGLATPQAVSGRGENICHPSYLENMANFCSRQ